MQTENVVVETRAPFRAHVSAIPADGRTARFRAGPPGHKLRWSTEPVEVRVAEVPNYNAEPIVISFTDWRDLQDDKHVRAIPLGADGAIGNEIAQLKAALLEAEGKAIKLQEQLATVAEERHSERARFDQAWAELGEKLRAAEGEIGNLRAKLAAKKRENGNG